MTAAALRRVTDFRPHAAVVFGSGLAGLPHGAVVEAELGYDELGWPCTAVPGHANLLRLARVPAPGGAVLRLALACGRPHFYEGWSAAELARPVTDLAACGARRVALTNSCGALRPEVEPGGIVVCREVADLQRPPAGPEPGPGLAESGPGLAEAVPRLPVCGEDEAAAVARAVDVAGGAAPAAVTGVYVAVAGPQFETPAEAAWLAGLGDVVGMSAAPEVRAARAAGAACCLLGLVANRAAAIGSHQDVLAAGVALAGALAAALPAAVVARWPEIVTTSTQGASWT